MLLSPDSASVCPRLVPHPSTMPLRPAHKQHIRDSADFQEVKTGVRRSLFNRESITYVNHSTRSRNLTYEGVEPRTQKPLGCHAGLTYTNQVPLIITPTTTVAPRAYTLTTPKTDEAPFLLPPPPLLLVLVLVLPLVVELLGDLDEPLPALPVDIAVAEAAATWFQV